MPQVANPQLKARVLELLQQGIPRLEIARQTGAKPNTIKTWSARNQWIRPPLVRGKPLDDPRDASVQVLRKLLSVVTKEATEVLASKPSGTVPGVLRRVNAIKSLVDSAEKLEGWDQQAQRPTFALFVLDKSESNQQPAIDVESVPCGVDAPSGGVLPENSEATTPQV